MKYVYFEFEGRFIEPDDEFDSLFSTSLGIHKAIEADMAELEAGLLEYGVVLVEINEKSIFSDEDVDPLNRDNASWISAMNAVKKSDDIVFTPWNTFDSSLD